MKNCYTSKRVIYLVIVIFLFTLTFVSANNFTETFTNNNNVNRTARLIVNNTNKYITLRSDANVFSSSETLLLTSLGNETDITNPEIALGGGGNVSGVSYTTGGGGYSGEALIINSSSDVNFSASENFNPKKGTIDFWLNNSDWGKIKDELILYTTDGDKTFQVIRTALSKVRLSFCNSSDCIYSQSIAVSDYDPGSWHQFTFSWNIEEDSYYMAVWEDDVFSENNEIADPVPNDINISSLFNSFNFTTLYVGRRPDSAAYDLNATIDELRITNTEFSNNNYTSKPGIIVSEAFDTGLTSPIWGNISWDETLPEQTDIELQTSVSDDGVTWSNWFSTNQSDKGMITLTFDDGRDDIYTNATSIMDKYNFSGVFYIVPNWVGTSGYCSVTQIKELQDEYSWEIASHTMNHGSPTISNLNDSKVWLIDEGLGYSSLAYPGGVFSQSIINITSDYYDTARTIVNHQYMTYDNKYRLYNYPGNAYNTGFQEIIDVTAANKGWQIIVFHSVGGTGKSGNIGVDDFDSLLSYLNSSNVDVVTMEEALSRLGMYTNNTGEQITSQNRRYIRYRAILWSYDGISSSNLSNITIYYSSVNATTFDGLTPDFFTINTTDISNLILEKQEYGRINFSESVDLSAVSDLNAHVNISNNYISINSTALAELNKSATLSLYNLTFENPRILKDSDICPSTICTKISYSEGTLIFNVTGFSSYSAEETPISEGGFGSNLRNVKSSYLESGVPKVIEFNLPGLPVISVIITLSRSALLDLSAGIIPESFVEAKLDDAYAYFELSSNLKNDYFSGILINFKVKKDYEDIRLYQLSDEWNKLGIVNIYEDSKYKYYQTSVASLGYFAVTGEQVEVEKQEQVIVESKEEKEPKVQVVKSRINWNSFLGAFLLLNILVMAFLFYRDRMFSRRIKIFGSVSFSLLVLFLFSNVNITGFGVYTTGTAGFVGILSFVILIVIVAIIGLIYLIVKLKSREETPIDEEVRFKLLAKQIIDKLRNNRVSEVEEDYKNLMILYKKLISEVEESEERELYSIINEVYKKYYSEVMKERRKFR